MRTLSQYHDEPQFESREEADAALEEAKEEHEEYVASLLEADVDVADTSVVASAAVSAAKGVLLARAAVRSLTTVRENGHGREVYHRRIRKLRRGTRMYGERYTDWIVFDREDVRARMDDMEELVAAPDWAVGEAALQMAREEGFETMESRSRALGDTFRRPAKVDVRGSRVLVSTIGGLDV